MAEDRDAIGERIRTFREALGLSQEEMAKWIVDLVGAGTRGSRISDWENTPKRHPYVLAAIALLHPDPRPCLKWLREGGTMPPLETLTPPATDVERLERDGRLLLRAAAALRVMNELSGEQPDELTARPFRRPPGASETGSA